MRFVKRVSAPDTYDVYSPVPGVAPGLWVGVVSIDVEVGDRTRDRDFSCFACGGTGSAR